MNIKIKETGEVFKVKKATKDIVVFWLNEHIVTKFDTVVRIGIISRHKVEFINEQLTLL